MPTLKNYLSLIKFSHSIFAMPFALIGFVLGTQNSINISTPQHISTFIFMLLCMIFARSAAMAFNRYLDSNFDAKNDRTAIREIPAGIISEKNVLVFHKEAKIECSMY